jgi:hypothetical protein
MYDVGADNTYISYKLWKMHQHVYFLQMEKYNFLVNINLKTAPRKQSLRINRKNIWHHRNHITGSCNLLIRSCKYLYLFGKLSNGLLLARQIGYLQHNLITNNYQYLTLSYITSLIVNFFHYIPVWIKNF